MSHALFSVFIQSQYQKLVTDLTIILRIQIMTPTTMVIMSNVLAVFDACCAAGTSPLRFASWVLQENTIPAIPGKLK